MQQSERDESDGLSVDRRGFLALAGASVTAGLAGCGDQGSGGPSGGGESSLDSPSSELAPTDGFATISPDLLGDDVTVERVTNLETRGDGSLRAAATGSDDPTLVVFEVGGVVDLEGHHLGIDASNTLIAGQTAPSPGITLVRGGVAVFADSVVVQHVRVRSGDEMPEDFGTEGGAVDAMGATGRSSNVVFDHCTATWGTDENMSAASGAAAVTFSNNLVAEGLRDSIHPDGEHAMGTLVGNGADDVAIYGNVWAHNMERHPRLKGGTTSVVVNNVAHNFEDGVRIGVGTPDRAETSLVGNYYQAGTRTDTDDPVVWIDPEAAGPTVYLEDNAVSEDAMTLAGESVDPVEERPVWSEALSPMPAAEVLEHNLATAGARPADRTEHDARIVEDVRQGTGDHVDSQDDLGGYPDLESTERELDVPDSGIREWLLQHTRAVELPDAEPP